MSRPSVGSSSTSRLRVDGHDQREVELGHHALRELPDLAGALDGGLRQEALRLRAIESRMHAGDVVERLRDPHPARQHGDVGDEADVAHEPVALRPGVAPEHLQLALVGGEAEDRVERGGLARAVGTDEPEDAALFDAQVDAVERDGRAEGLAQAARFDAGHGFSAPLAASGAGAPVAAAASSSCGVRPSRWMVAWTRGHCSARNFWRSPCSSRSRAPALTNMPSPRLLLDQLLVDQLLIALQDRERIDPIFGRDGAHRRQRIAFLEHAVEDHRDDPVAKLPVDRLTVVPLSVHDGFQIPPTREAASGRSVRRDRCTSFIRIAMRGAARTPRLM